MIRAVFSALIAVTLALPALTQPARAEVEIQ